MWKYLLITFLVTFQGGLVIIASAGVASAGYLSLSGVIIASAIGNICSDVFWYAVGYHSRMHWLLKKVPWLGITPEKVDLAAQIIQKDALHLLIFAKLTSWLSVPALIAMGVAKASWRKWLWFIVLSDILIASLFSFLGFHLTSAVMHIESRMRYVGIGLAIVGVLASIFYIRKILIRVGGLATQKVNNQI
jgi:membrane protein DedA with SNARE-associated domain